jgi:Mg-chelatase subunit ChlI
MTFVRPFRAVVALALSLPIAACFARGVDGERARQMVADMQKRFAAADANGDGRLTKDEAKGKMPFVYEHFDEIDTAHSGSIAIADIAAFARTKQAERR